MSGFPLTPAQRDAVEAPLHAAVTAAAGSGKTRVLVERLLWLLLQDPARRPGDLLAITFTNRAAAEMRWRLRQRLREIAQDAATPATQREQALACLDAFHGAAVMTIHAFAVEILRAHPFEAGRDPAFAVADEIEARALRRGWPPDAGDRVAAGRARAEAIARDAAAILEPCPDQRIAARSAGTRGH